MIFEQVIWSCDFLAAPPAFPCRLSAKRSKTGSCKKNVARSRWNSGMKPGMANWVKPRLGTRMALFILAGWWMWIHNNKQTTSHMIEIYVYIFIDGNRFWPIPAWENADLSNKTLEASWFYGEWLGKLVILASSTLVRKSGLDKHLTWWTRTQPACTLDIVIG